jgi:hypothetical protein
LNPLIEVNLAEVSGPRFSHMLTAEAKKILKKSSLRDNCRRRIGFSENDVNLPPKAQISGCEGVRVNCRTNALSVSSVGATLLYGGQRVPPRAWRQAMDEAEEWGEVSVAD